MKMIELSDEEFLFLALAVGYATGGFQKEGNTAIAEKLLELWNTINELLELWNTINEQHPDR